LLQKLIRQNSDENAPEIFEFPTSNSTTNRGSREPISFKELEREFIWHLFYHIHAYLVFRFIF